MLRRACYRPLLRWLLAVAFATGCLLCSFVGSPPVAHAQGDEADWLVMIYSDADDNILEEDMMIDLQEAELVGSTDEVTIVVQSDRYKGGYKGFGNWTSAKRFLITQDDDMSTLNSQELEDL